MVKQLKRLFADAITSTPVGAQATSQPKEEPVFYNENNNSSVYYGNSRRRNWYRGNGGRNRRQNNPPQPKKEGNGMKGILNPVDRDGNITGVEHVTANTIGKVSVLYDQKHRIQLHCFNRKILTTKKQKYLQEKL